MTDRLEDASTDPSEEPTRPASRSRGADGGQSKMVVAIATFAAFLVLLGVQGVSPITPDIRDEFGLDSTTIAAFTFIYVIGGAVFGFPATALADRFGIRNVLVTALVIFGLLGLAGAGTFDFTLLLLIRLAQGAAFGAVIALTIVLTSVEGSPLASARLLRVRTVVMAFGEAVLPVMVGSVATLFGWRVAFALQGIAILAAVACLKWVPKDVRKPHKKGDKGGVGAMGTALRTLATPFGAVAQLPALARFMVKYSLLTYVPILAADHLDLDAAGTGLVIGAGALVAVGSAAIAPYVLARARTGGALTIAVGFAAAPLLLIPLVTTPLQLAGIMMLSGIGDGLLGVYLNVFAIAAAPSDARAAYLGLSGSIRNVAKVVAPAVVGGMILIVPLGVALAIAGIVGLLPLAGVPTTVRGVAAATRKP